MGTVSRQSRSGRFIQEFGADVVAKDRIDSEKAWKCASQSLGVNDADGCVSMYFTLKCVETGEEIVLTDGYVVFDPESDENLVEALAYQLDLSEEEVAPRVERADLE